VGSLQKILSVNLWIAFAEHGVARDKNFCAGADHVANGVECDTAIDLDAEIKPSFRAQVGEPAHFMQGAGNKFLAAEPGIDRHHEDIIHNVEHFCEGVDRGGGIDDDPRLCAMFFDVLQGAVQVYAGFLMHRDPVRTGLHEVGDELVGVLDHEMTIERQAGDFPQRSYDRRPDGEIRNEMAIHNVDVND